VVEVFPSYQDQAFRIELWAKRWIRFPPSTRCLRGDPETHGARSHLSEEHYVMSKPTIRALKSIKEELNGGSPNLFRRQTAEAQRLHQRTMFDSS